ncbi:MAG: DNA-directed RNA polymerase subunit beta [Phycisphaerales bacterium]|nr:DNA-directed RNA polymerase subunit beta [Phycisphaerales bacterium]
MHTPKLQRKTFGSQKYEVKIPDLLDIQIESFKNFFQFETTPDKRNDEGLFSVFKENFPITDNRNIFLLEFLDYFVDPPLYTMEECLERGLTFSVPLKAKLRLSCNDPEHVDFHTITQNVFFGNIPYMTPKGTFIVNGSERVVVSQLHRSPGVFFSQSLHPNGTKLYNARVIPFKGAWMEFTTDVNNTMYAYIDRKNKFPVTTLLRAIGYETDRDILELFDMAEAVTLNAKDSSKYEGRILAERVLRTWTEDEVDENSGEVITKIRTEVVIDRGEKLTPTEITKILELQDSVFLQKEQDDSFSIIVNTFKKEDPAVVDATSAAKYIYKQLRGGTDAPDDDTAKGIIDKSFFSDKRYDLGDVGRFKINRKLKLDKIVKEIQKKATKTASDKKRLETIQADLEKRVLSKSDIVEIIKYLVKLTNDKAEIDDIDHLCNRRVKTVGEQLSAQFSLGLARIARTIKERLNVRDNEVFTPDELTNSRALSSVINTFFGTSQLSQFLDQTNPLSEITHKRRISALGPGGLSRDRAGFEVRDIHYSHYGRLCAIETPEGANIGLISSLCVYAKINNKGFIETPYYEVTNGKVNFDKVKYLSPEQEDEMEDDSTGSTNEPQEEGGLKFPAIAQFNVSGEGGKIKDKVFCRVSDEFTEVDSKEVKYIDVAPNQIMGLSASLIPFLEHDDANRALMGSNMQRQAVPLIKPEVPIVGTGFEAKAAQDSKIQILSEGNGRVEYVDANEIHIRYEKNDMDKLVSFETDVKVYKLTKFIKTNMATCINLHPAVYKGDKVRKGDFLTEGYAIKDGEMALGRNLKVAFMPWKGYNFEDAIVISQKVVRDDWFTSIHVEEYELQVRETKLGNEILTSDIPNVSEDATKDLDENGVVRIGASIKEGDILIGKITPKGETDPTPEEKLLLAIFGEKAGEHKDASLRAPNGVEGTVIDKKLFERVVAGNRERTVTIADVEKKHQKNIKELNAKVQAKLVELLKGKVCKTGIQNKFGEEIIEKGTKFNDKLITKLLNSGQDNENALQNVNSNDWTGEHATDKFINQLVHNFNIEFNKEIGRYKREKFNISIGDELPTGVIKLAKVYIAVKRKLKVGDKMAGRHGNKGIVAKIVREEDMPFLEDGTPVDIVLNPLGVPSRMNVGQIYETVLGWCGQKLGVNYATPIFDGAKPNDIVEKCKEAKIPDNGHTYLYDGETGERLHQKATVGVIYMIKLHHMVDDKMHARSIGPYSLITQQPLGGKAQFGGQRFGEMEVWALEAYGAANILQEMLTIKSDDIQGRSRTFDAITKGENLPRPGVPESFNVLTYELRGLGLDIKFE